MQPALVAMVTTHSVTAHCRKYLLISYVRVKVYSKQRLAMLLLHKVHTITKYTHKEMLLLVVKYLILMQTSLVVLEPSILHTLAAAEWCQ